MSVNLIAACKLLGIFLSFLGLNSIVIQVFQLRDNGYASPLITSSAIIVALMLAGMVHALGAMWWLLIALGAFGFVFNYFIKRRGVQWLPLALALVGLLYAFLHYRGTYFLHNDSVSHWALVAKYLLRNNRFPDASATMVYFPSYPLGTAVYIYYFCRATGVDAGMFLAAQAALCWMALMPLFGFVKKNKCVAGSFAFVMMVFLFALNRHRYSLQVDALMGYMTAGATCLVLQTPKSQFRTTLALLPIAVAFVFIKTSGILMSALILALAAKRLRDDGDRRWLWALIAALAIVLLAMLGWQVYMRHAFAGVTTGKHTISVNNYRSHLQSKNVRFMAQVALNMLRSLVKPEAQLLLIPMLALAFAVVVIGKTDREKWTGQFRRLVLYTVIVFVAWQALLFVTYVFTMDNREASILASFERYQSTAVLYLLAVAAMFIVSRISQMRQMSKRQTALITTGILAGGVICALLPVQGSSFAEKLFDRNQGGQSSFAYILSLRERNPDIEEGKRYIVLAGYDTAMVHNVTKYEFFSNDILLIHKIEDAEAAGAPLAAIRKTNIYEKDMEPVTDLAGYLGAIVEDYDYILVYDRDDLYEEALDKVLADHAGAVQVCYSYK